MLHDGAAGPPATVRLSGAEGGAAVVGLVDAVLAVPLTAIAVHVAEHYG